MKLNRVTSHLLIAFTIVTLFFAPLLKSLRVETWYFQWSRKDTYAFIAAYALLFSAVVFILWFTARIPGPRLRIIILMMIAIVPFLSFLFSIYVIQIHPIKTTAVGTVFLLGIIIWLYCRPSQVRQFFFAIILIFSPLNISLLWSVISVEWFENLDIERPVGDHQTSLPNVYFFLFDELSPNFLYDNEGQILPAFPNIAEFSSVSDNYHNARTLKTQTFHSVPMKIFGIKDKDVAIKNGRLVMAGDDGNYERLSNNKQSIFSKAKEQGYVTAAFGPYFRYCSMLRDALDICHSYSVYNYSGVNRKFSIVNPIATTIMLWPAVPPFTWLKYPITTNWQSKGIAQTLEWTINAFRLSRQAFLYTHFFIPHRPFTFDRQGYNPPKKPLLESDENYVRQVEYVDTVVGKLVSELKALDKFDNSAIIIFSDHNFRSRFPEDKDHIVFMVKHAGQNQRVDIQDAIHASDIFGKL